MAECAPLHPGRAPHPPHNSHGQPLDGGTAGHRHGGQGGALHSPVILSHTLAQYTIVTLSVIYLVNIILSGKLFPTYFTFKFSWNEVPLDLATNIEIITQIDNQEE